MCRSSRLIADQRARQDFEGVVSKEAVVPRNSAAAARRLSTVWCFRQRHHLDFAGGQALDHRKKLSRLWKPIVNVFMILSFSFSVNLAAAISFAWVSISSQDLPLLPPVPKQIQPSKPHPITSLHIPTSSNHLPTTPNSATTSDLETSRPVHPCRPRRWGLS